MDFINNLEKYAQKAVKIATKNLDLNKVRFDHVCYQTVSDKDYRKALNELKDEIRIVSEIPHAGRRITLADLKNPINIKNGII